jgi:hypothetical protein
MKVEEVAQARSLLDSVNVALLELAGQGRCPRCEALAYAEEPAELEGVPLYDVRHAEDCRMLAERAELERLVASWHRFRVESAFAVIATPSPVAAEVVRVVVGAAE